jgi:hypothetical protein
MTHAIALSALVLSLGLSALGFVTGIPATAQEVTPTPEPAGSARVDIALGLPQQGYEIIADPAAYGLPPLPAAEMYVRLDTQVFRMRRADAAILDTVGTLVAR